jgi:hypothetical protein
LLEEASRLPSGEGPESPRDARPFQCQGRARLLQDFFRQLLVVEETRQRHRATHSGPSGYSPAPFLFGRVAICLNTETVDQAANGLRQFVSEIGRATRGFRSQA